MAGCDDAARRSGAIVIAFVGDIISCEPGRLQQSLAVQWMRGMERTRIVQGESDVWSRPTKCHVGH